MNMHAAISLGAMLLLAPAASTPAADRQAVPEGLSGSDWSSIRAAYEANRHAIFPVEGSVGVPPGYQARNPGQSWRTRFDGRGFLTTPDVGGWSWGLELVCGDASPVVSTCGQRLEYAWTDALTEWYVNDQRGLEHGFTLHRRPNQSPDRKEGAHSLVRDSYLARPSAGIPSGEWAITGTDSWTGGCEKGFSHQRPVHSQQDHSLTVAALELTLAVRGDLRPQVSGDGRSVAFVNDAGAAVVNYGGLMVFDARGVALPAKFEAVSTQPGGAGVPACLSGRRGPLQQTAFSIVVDDSEAVYPLTIDPIAQQAYLKASNTGAGDAFGVSVAVDGDTVVVGAPGEASGATVVNGNQADNSVLQAGAAYVFVRSGTSWSQQAYLKASNSGSGDQYGQSVAVSGNTVVVGATYEDSNATGVNGNQASNTAADAGAAYVYVRSGGVWSQQAYLKASNTGAGDQFGQSVAASGDTVVVGAYHEDSAATGVNGSQADNSTTDAGAAYVFTRSGTTWSQEAYVKASNTGIGDGFGWEVAASGDTVVVGAYSEDSSATGVNGNGADNGTSASGAAYVFFRSGGSWSQQAYLKASNTGVDDFFGISVAASGDTVVIGARYEDSSATGVDGNGADNGTSDSGAAYVFVRSAGVWSQQAYLKASNPGVNDQYGNSVAASGDLVVIGAGGEDSNATGVNGNQADNSATSSGAAYVFVRSSGAWSQQAYVKASNTGAGDGLGESVAASGDTVVVGAPGEASSAVGANGNQADNSATSSGAAYVFVVDSDGDGAFDSIDVCPNTPPGLAVCGNGRPQRDCNNDCLVDAADIQCIVNEILSQ